MVENSYRSTLFFGNTKFTQVAPFLSLYHYHNYTNQKKLSLDEVRSIFPQQCSKLQHRNQPSKIAIQIFAEFINLHLDFGLSLRLKFQKLTAWIEIIAHVFIHTFDNWMNKSQSFKYFTNILVRHSLFRPPHSVHVFNYEDVKALTQHWIQTFCRYFQQYFLCIPSQKEQCIEWEAIKTQFYQRDFKTSKIVGKQIFTSYFNS